MVSDPGGGWARWPHRLPPTEDSWIQGQGTQFLPLPESASSDGGWKMTVEAWARYPLTAVWGLHVLRG